MNGHHAESRDGTHDNQVPSQSRSESELLREFMSAQATRTGINNELQIAFDERGITDAALSRVIEISSVGLLEVRAKIEAIVGELERKQGPSAAEAVRLCAEVERLERERLTQATRKQQLQRIRHLSSTASSSQEGNEEQLVDGPSDEQQHAISSDAEAIKTALSQAQDRYA